MKRLARAGLAAAALLLGAAADAPAPLLAQIQADGAKSVIAQLSAGHGAAFDQVVAHIQTGARPWLDVGLALKPGADAGTAEALSSAMATALLHNPTDVLRLAVPIFGEAMICNVPLIEPTQAQQASYVAQAHTALDSVQAADLTALARRCAVTIGQ